MDRILGDLGIDILKAVHERRVAPGIRSSRESAGRKLRRQSRSSDRYRAGVGRLRLPTGIELEKGVALPAACVLLDHRNFGFINGDDLPTPQVGLRVKRGASTLDIFISLEGSSPNSPHQDVWIEVHDDGGRLVHSAGPICINDPTLQKLAEELLRG